MGALRVNSRSISSSKSSSSTDLSLDNLVDSTSSFPNVNQNSNNSEIEGVNVRNSSSIRIFNFFINYYEFITKLLIGFLISGLRNSGPMPKHVAIIMDGNRRYAKKKGLSNLSEGHLEGAKTLEKVHCTKKFIN